MTSPSDGLLDDATTDDSKPPNGELVELRRLLLAPEQQQIEELREKLALAQVNAETVGDVLPQAVTLRSTPDKSLTEALLPTVEEAVSISVKRDPQVLIDALFPVMGPAIRKAIADALGSMTQSLNQTLEHSFTPRGLKWRIEAWRTGRSFGEVVLLHNLVYRVEQVFLIHREAGLLLLHEVAGNIKAQDADMVSGMLTAIQDFVHDSFSTQTEETLDTLQVGELTVWIEQGPQAILAGVIRGNAPNDFRTVFKEAIERIHMEQGEELRAFTGDASVFEPSRKYLEACLGAQYQEGNQPREKRRGVSPVQVLGVVVLLALLVWGFFLVRDRLRWNDYLAKLKSEPGIVVTKAERGWFTHSIEGLRDPLASDPTNLLTAAKLDPEDVASRWEPYQALNPVFVEMRARSALNPPPSVTLKFENGTLFATGTASHRWVVEANKVTRAVAGVSQFNRDGLIDTEQSQLDSMKKSIEDQPILFIQDSTQFSPGQDAKIESIASQLEKLLALAPTAGMSVRLELIGHTDSTGTEGTNMALSQDRAEQVRAALNSRLRRSLDMKTDGVGTREPLRPEFTDQDREVNRSVTVRVHLMDTI